MDFKKSKRLLAWAAAVYWVFVLGIYIIAYPQFRYAPVTGEKLVADTVVGEVVDGQEYRQTLVAPCDVIEQISIKTSTYERENSGTLEITVQTVKGIVLAEITADIAEFTNNEYDTIPLQAPIEVGAGEKLVFVIRPHGCKNGDTITIYASGSITANKATEDHLLNGEQARGTLCIQMSGHSERSFYITYLVIVAALFALLAAYALWCWKRARSGKPNLMSAAFTLFSKYSFLLKQLVSRDFKQKYKRSKLGMAWSVMNPLLTMTVQYVVFSTLFKSGIPNYPVYLLTGIVFFSFFNESVNSAMMAIIANASLIKKVYMPRYIFPVSRVVTSLLNFGMALIPLALIVVITRVPIRASVLLLVFDILCFLLFIVGLALLLSTVVTFFQDVLHLWGVLCMIWQYLTPIFYPETIIPVQVLAIYRLNPLYQFITFARTCIIDGISPAPQAYFLCLLYGVGMLVLGAAIFKKYQNEFVFRI